MKNIFAWALFYEGKFEANLVFKTRSEAREWKRLSGIEYTIKKVEIKVIQSITS